MARRSRHGAKASGVNSPASSVPKAIDASAMSSEIAAACASTHRSDERHLHRTPRSASRVSNFDGPDHQEIKHRSDQKGCVGSAGALGQDLCLHRQLDHRYRR